MRLLDFIKENKEEARKIFGKKELEIVEKQLKGMALTQSQKNRLSRDIRPKFKFIDRCSFFRQEFNLKKNQINKDLIKESLKIILKDKLAKKYERIMLAGSFSDSSHTERSDIDIVVEFKEPLSLKEATLFRIRLLGELPDKIDLQVLNTLPDNIRKTIEKNNKILYAQSKNKEKNRGDNTISR